MGVLDGVMMLSGVIWIILAPFGIAAAVIILAWKSHAAKARRKRDQEWIDGVLREGREEARQRREEKERKERKLEEWSRDFQSHIDNAYRILDECEEKRGDRIPTPEEMRQALDKLNEKRYFL